MMISNKGDTASYGHQSQASGAMQLSVPVSCITGAYRLSHWAVIIGPEAFWLYMLVLHDGIKK
jgi:hypothetical protein